MELLTTHICMAKDIGVHGNMFGGIMMAWMDEAASALSVQVCRTPNMVTVQMNELVFKKKVKEGFLIKIYGEVVRIGNTSITLKLEAQKESIYTGEGDMVCSTTTTFVRIDEAGEPTPIASSIKEKYKHLVKA